MGLIKYIKGESHPTFTGYRYTRQVCGVLVQYWWSIYKYSEEEAQAKAAELDAYYERIVPNENIANAIKNRSRPRSKHLVILPRLILTCRIVASRQYRHDWIISVNAPTGRLCSISCSKRSIYSAMILANERLAEIGYSYPTELLVAAMPSKAEVANYVHDQLPDILKEYRTDLGILWLQDQELLLPDWNLNSNADRARSAVAEV